MNLLAKVVRQFRTGGVSGVVQAIRRRVLPNRTIDENQEIANLFKGHRPGVMIDVGACQGHTLTPFAQFGWKVYAFEPDPDNRAVLERQVKSFPGVEISPSAITEKDGDTLSFYASDESPGISSLTAFTTGHRLVAQVHTERLDAFASRKGIAAVDYVKVDAEGHDLFVLKSYPFGSVPPSVVLCEFEDNKTAALGYRWEDMADFLVAQGYDVYVSEWKPIKRYGTEHSWRGSRVYPTRLVDPKGWGNLIAVKIGSPLTDAARRVFAHA